MESVESVCFWVVYLLLRKLREAKYLKQLGDPSPLLLFFSFTFIEGMLNLRTREPDWPFC